MSAKAVIVLPKLKIENANAVNGLTQGFPGVSAFLGAVHALDRQLCRDSTLDSLLGGCAIVCHQHQTHSYADEYGEHTFALTRNPLSRKGETVPFNEEGRMHLELTLLIECQCSAEEYIDSLAGNPFDDSEQTDEQILAQCVVEQLGRLRIAGGMLVSHGFVECVPLTLKAEEKARAVRRLLRRCLPGFALVDRSELLTKHLAALQAVDPETDLLQAWMDFAGLRYRASHPDPEQAAEWSRVPLPDSGWLVPLMIGYQAIAPLQAPEAVISARDLSVPFAAVEGVYGVGQWLNPLRVSDLEALFWRYDYQPEQAPQYRFLNTYSDFSQDILGAS